MRSADEWRDVLGAALRDAVCERQVYAVAALRATLAAIGNAEAVDANLAPRVQHGVIAGGVAGLDAGEVPRRRLSADEVTAIIERQIQDRRSAASTYAALGRDEEAAVLRRQVDVLVALSCQPGPGGQVENFIALPYTRELGAWTELSPAEHDDVCTRFERVFAFRPDTRLEGWPGILEPTPSRTYRFEYPVHPLDEGDLRDSALRAFKECVSPGHRMYSLDWNHACYWFDPHAVSIQEWFHPVFPDGDYYIFLARDFSWGLFGHPWEQTICIFDAPLIEAFAARPTKMLRDLARQK